MPVPWHQDWPCTCGKCGCLEVTASATGIVRSARQFSPFDQMEDLTARDVFDAARNGDALAAREVDEMADTLGLALSIIAETVDPEIFLVGGGVARAGEVLFAPLTAHYKEYAFRSCRETPIRQASLGNDAGIYGAVRLIVGG